LATYQTAGVNAKVSAKTVTLLYTISDGSWSCTSNLDVSVKPKSCG